MIQIERKKKLISEKKNTKPNTYVSSRNARPKNSFSFKSKCVATVSKRSPANKRGLFFRMRKKIEMSSNQSVIKLFTKNT